MHCRPQGLRCRAPALRVLGLVFGVLVAAGGGQAVAAPEEIEVYRDEVTPTHAWGAEINQNYVASASADEARSGDLSPVHLYRLTPEIDYGVARNWEVGVLAETTVRNREFDVHGLAAHVRYIAPRPQDSPWYWGLNFEAGFTDKHLEERPATFELRGIFGYEGRRWIVAFNPTLATAANSQATDPITFELQGKLGYRATEKLIVGLESYNEFGPVRDFGPVGQQPQMLYAAVDYEWRGLALNFGVGRGLTRASDGWTLKTAISVPLGKR